MSFELLRTAYDVGRLRFEVQRHPEDRHMYKALRISEKRLYVLRIKLANEMGYDLHRIQMEWGGIEEPITESVPQMRVSLDMTTGAEEWMDVDDVAAPWNSAFRYVLDGMYATKE